MDAGNAVKYDFDAFTTEGTAAPKKKFEEEKRSNIKKVAPKTKDELQAQERAGLKKSVALLVFVSIIFTFIAIQISAGAKNYQLARQIHRLEAELKVEKAENIRLNSELNGITGIAVIDTYATEILGMTRVENYQIECIDLSEGDAVIYSAGGFVG